MMSPTTSIGADGTGSSAIRLRDYLPLADFYRRSLRVDGIQRSWSDPKVDLVKAARRIARQVDRCLAPIAVGQRDRLRRRTIHEHVDFNGLVVAGTASAERKCDSRLVRGHKESRARRHELPC